jgi:hypothetical protein
MTAPGMKTPADRLARLLQFVPDNLAGISEAEASRTPVPGRWSKKQILGHLIDSAGNNHQRIVRAQIEARLDFPGYEQESWVAVQSYANESWPDLVDLWQSFNRHLLHVIMAVPEASLSRPCAIGGREPIPLAEVIDGYVDHVEHHLEQIASL